MKELILFGGEIAFIDDDDYERLKDNRYSFNGGYAVRRSEALVNDTLHHDVIGKPLTGSIVHHKNGNTLDNRKENLETIPRSVHNQKHAKRTFGYIGVAFLKGRNKPYQGQVRFKGKMHSTKTFFTAEEAAHARDLIARQLMGPQCVLNFPNFEEPSSNVPDDLVN